MRLSCINSSHSSFKVKFNETGKRIIVNKAALMFINQLQASSFFWNLQLKMSEPPTGTSNFNCCFL